MNAPDLFLSFRFRETAPHLPEGLIEAVRAGLQTIEIDEQLYFYLKALFYAQTVFANDERFIFCVSRNPEQFSDAYRMDERFFVRPPGVVEH